MYCTSSTTDLHSIQSDEYIKDSYALVRGCNHSMLNSIQSNYLPKCVNKNPPPLTLKLDHVFGFEFSRRNTVQFAGITDPKTYGYARRGTPRRPVWLADRIAVVLERSSSETKTQQKFYEDHNKRISCMAVHPLKRFIATGEASVHPMIHVWNFETLKPVSLIRSYHTSGIISLSFDILGNRIVSVAVGKIFSIQLIDWTEERIIAFKNTSTRPIVEARIDPFDFDLIITAGPGYIELFKLKGNDLQSHKLVFLDSDPTGIITCLECLFFFNQTQNDSEYLLGNYNGDLLTFNGRMDNPVTVQSKAHQGSINCIKITCCVDTVIYIMTTGEDECVKIWNAELMIVRSFNIREQFFPLVGLNNRTSRSVSAQSLDFWHKRSNAPGSMPLLLIGTRNGFILEAEIEPPGIQPEVSGGKRADQTVSEGGISHIEGIFKTLSSIKALASITPSKEYLKVSLVFRSQNLSDETSVTKPNPNGKTRSQLTAINRVKDHLTIIDRDNIVLIWNYNTKSFLVEYQLEQKVTAIVWHPEGEYLMVGYYNGELDIFELSEAEILKAGVKRGLNLVTSLNTDSKAPILNIEFNSNGDLMAVSFCNSLPGMQDSFVLVFIHKNIAAKQGITALEEGIYFRYFDIRSPSIQATYQGEFDSFGMAVYFMSFSKDSRFLMVYFQLIDTNLQRNNSSEEGVYILWDLKLNNTIKSWEIQREAAFSYMKFPNHLNGRYRLHSRSQRDDITDYKESKTVFCSVNQFEGLDHNTPLVMGDWEGYLIISMLSSMNSTSSDKPDQTPCLALVYPAHSSPVDWIDRSADCRFLFTRAETDYTFMWKVQMTEESTELDYQTEQSTTVDVVLGEIPSSEKFHYQMNSILQMRSIVENTRSIMNQDNEGEIYLKLENIVNRRAYNSRNDICCSHNNKLLYLSASAIVEVDIPEPDKIIDRRRMQNKFDQEFLYPGMHSESTQNPELCCIACCKKQRVIAIGTYEPVCRVFFWNIITHTFLGQIVFRRHSKVHSLKYADDCKTVSAMLIHQNYYSSLVILDSELLEIVCQVELNESAIGKIRGTLFTHELRTVVTYGLLHLKKWTQRGSIMIGKGMRLGAQAKALFKDAIELGEYQHEDNGQNISYLAGEQFQNYLFLGGDDGCVTLEYRPSIKAIATLGAPILCISKDSSTVGSSGCNFVTGSYNGKVILWEFSNPEGIEKLNQIKEFPLASNIENVGVSPEHQIQSLVFRDQNIIVGTRSGAIYFVSRDVPEEFRNKDPDVRDHIHVVFEPIDHLTPCEASIERRSTFVLQLTMDGHLGMWELPSLERKDFQKMGEDSVRLLQCRNRGLIFCVFRHEILGINVESNYLVREPKLVLYYLRNIGDARMSRDDSLLAIYIEEDQEKKGEIRLLQIHPKDGFLNLTAIEDLVSEVEVMDFTEDGAYLMYKEALGQKVFFDLSSFKATTTLGQNFDPPFVSTGITLSPQALPLAHSQTDQLKYTSMARIGHRSLVTVDTTGMIQIHPYPIKAYPGLKLYSQHLAMIENIEVSVDGTMAVTSSSYDKAVMVWSIHKVAQGKKKYKVIKN